MRLVRGCAQLDLIAAAGFLGRAVHRLGRGAAGRALGLEAVARAVAGLEAGRARIDDAGAALAAVELRDLPERERVALAGIAGEIEGDAPARRLDVLGRLAVVEHEIVDGPVRGEHDALGRGLRPGARARRQQRYRADHAHKAETIFAHDAAVPLRDRSNLGASLQWRKQGATAPIATTNGPAATGMTRMLAACPGIGHERRRP